MAVSEKEGRNQSCGAPFGSVWQLVDTFFRAQPYKIPSAARRAYGTPVVPSTGLSALCTGEERRNSALAVISRHQAVGSLQKLQNPELAVANY
jgi:hypothetical protein